MGKRIDHLDACGSGYEQDKVKWDMQPFMLLADLKRQSVGWTDVSCGIQRICMCEVYMRMHEGMHVRQGAWQ